MVRNTNLWLCLMWNHVKLYSLPMTHCCVIHINKLYNLRGFTKNKIKIGCFLTNFSNWVIFVLTMTFASNHLSMNILIWPLVFVKFYTSNVLTVFPNIVLPSQKSEKLKCTRISICCGNGFWAMHFIFKTYTDSL